MELNNGGGSGGGGGDPGGNIYDVQYNDGMGGFAGDDGFVYKLTNVGIGTTSPGAKLDVRGTFLTQRYVSPQSSGATVANTDSFKVFTNEGAGSQATFALPTAVANLEYTFIVQDSDGVKVLANAGDTIRLGATVTAAAGNATSTVVGSTITLVAINATEWITTSSVGTWILT